MTIAIERILCITVVAAITCGSAMAQQEPESSNGQPEAPLWLISCSNAMNPQNLTCEFSQSIVLAQDNRRVATVSFARDVGQAEYTGVFTLPVGLFLPAGVTVSVDGQEVARADFETCTIQGCQTTAPVDPAWLDAMRAGEEMSLAVESLDRNPISFAFQLRDFTETEALLP